MGWSRNKYHYIIRKVKKQASNIQTDKLLTAASNGDAELIKEMKNIKGGKKQGQSLPDTVEGAEGPDEILDMFREVYKNLYNSAESIEAINKIKYNINERIGVDSVQEVNKITGEILK